TVAADAHRLVISSTRRLARDILTHSDQPKAENADGSSVVNTRVLLNAGMLQSVLADNRAHLIAQNMLKEGHSRDEAERQVDALLEITGLFGDAALNIATSESSLTVDIRIQTSGATRE